MIKSTKYCNLLARGMTKEGEDISAVERIFVKDLNREEIRFAWYKEKNGTMQFRLRPLDLPENELIELIRNGVRNEVFSKEFRESLKNIL